MATTKTPTSHLSILNDVLSLPTAPFAEHVVIDFIERFCAARPGVTLNRDAAGNLLFHLRRGRRRIARPVCITAHMDHPGFVVDRMIAKQRLRAHWRGGVPKEYFKGSRVRFYTDDGLINGSIRSIKTVVKLGRERVDTATIDVPKTVPTGSIGMWDFPDPRVRGQRIYARACDDLAGAAAMLCALDTLSRTRGSYDAYFLFTRAEEVGFIGAIAACRLKTIPKKCYIVAMETSSELPHARMGDGPILRVGDRASAFTPAVTAHCHRIARELEASNGSFRYQRKLMDGGTCESSAYCTLGYEATGLCVALGNYHNVNAAKKTLGPEYIDLTDFDHVVRWFIELAKAPHAYNGRDEALRDQINTLERTYRSLLRQSLRSPC